MSYIVAWSGGKDSCFACYKAIIQGYNIAYLLTFARKKCKRLLWHYGVDTKLIQLQAEALGLPLLQKQISFPFDRQLDYWLMKKLGLRAEYLLKARRIIQYKILARLIKNVYRQINVLMPFMFRYRQEYMGAVRDILSNDINTKGMIFGDIHSQRNKAWAERICAELGIEAVEPLFGKNTEKILLDFIDSGFEAIVIAAHPKLKKWIGKKIDREFLKYLKENNIDIHGENGEYHTFVIDGPIFKRSIKIIKSRLVTRYKYSFLDILEYSL